MANSLYVFRWLLVSCVTVDAVWAQCTMEGPVELGRKFTMSSIAEQMPFRPGRMAQKNVGEISYLDNHFCVGEHTGSHMDAPSHYNSTGWTIENIPTDRLLANGAFLDVSADVVATQPQGDFRVQKNHLDKWVERNGNFHPNTVLLIRYGWGQYYDNPKDYLGYQSERDGPTGNWPGLSPDAARQLVATGQIVGVGIDIPSMDPPKNGEIHSIFAASNLYNLENLNLDAHCLPEKDFKVHALPMSVPNGTGAPVRVVAMPNYEFIPQKS